MMLDESFFIFSLWDESKTAKISFSMEPSRFLKSACSIYDSHLSSRFRFCFLAVTNWGPVYVGYTTGILMKTILFQKINSFRSYYYQHSKSAPTIISLYPAGWCTGGQPSCNQKIQSAFNSWLILSVPCSIWTFIMQITLLHHRAEV